MIVEFPQEDASRVKWSHNDGKTWSYADIDELIKAYEGDGDMELTYVQDMAIVIRKIENQL